MSAFLYADTYDYELSGERRRFKGDKRWFVRCDECNDNEWYPVTEHKAWHFLYENMEDLSHRTKCTAEELRRIIGRRTFTYKETIGNEFKFTVTIKSEAKAAQKETETKE